MIEDDGDTDFACKEEGRRAKSRSVYHWGLFCYRHAAVAARIESGSHDVPTFKKARFGAAGAPLPIDGIMDGTHLVGTQIVCCTATNRDTGTQEVLFCA